MQVFLLLTLKNHMSTGNKFENQKQNYSWKFIDTVIPFIDNLAAVNDWLLNFANLFGCSLGSQHTTTYTLFVSIVFSCMENLN